MSDPISYLPNELQAAARKLPADKAHTVLSLPPEGDGHNAGLIHIAGKCYKMGVSYEDTLSHLQEIYSKDRIDYRSAPKRAALRIWQGEGEIVVDDESGELAAMPEVQDEMLLRFRRTPTQALVELSPGSTKSHPKKIIDALFDPDDIINIQHTAFEVGTLLYVRNIRVQPEFESISDYKFLNPSTFKNIAGVVNPLDVDEKIATRCNANVKSRPYMVLEMDSKEESSVERFTTFAITLSDFAPLVLAVDTGNKSIHFWFDTRKTTAAIVGAVFAIARMHGADKALSVKSQIARMSNVSSAGEGRGGQRVLYFDGEHERCPDGDKWDLKGFEQFILRAKQLEYYYLGQSGRYFAQDNVNSWTSLSRTSMTVQLARQGFRAIKADVELVSPTDEIMAGIEMDKSIEAALKGASGKQAGYYEENGFRVLVTKSPTFLKPRKGDWETIKIFMEHLLGEDPLQIQIVYGWLSSSIKDLRNGGRRSALYSPAQMAHFIGPANSGKTLLLKYILPALFGGRSAEANDIFDPKGSKFNSDVFQSELIYLDDVGILGTDFSSRSAFGELIKGITVGAGGSYHGKFGDKILMTPWWRIVRMMNEEPHTLATIPPMENGIEDKLILIHTQSMEGGPIDISTPGWFDGIRDQIIEETPAFLQFLMEEFRIPSEARDPHGRYAVKSYKNEWIMGEIESDSPEVYLLHKIDGDGQLKLFTDPDTDEWVEFWEGGSSILYDLLADSGSRNAQARFRKVCPSPRVLTSQLKALEEAHPERVQYSGRADLGKKKIDGVLFWRITKPATKTTTEITVEDCI